MIIAFTSCSSTKKTTHNPGTNNFIASTPKSTDDGLSYATAIVITETTETKGTAAEYEWIKQHYTNYKVKMQALNMQDNKPYDIITILLANDKELKLYFDISNFFGKF